ncbi:tRNA pseudouridine(55) synthase TruB [Myxococcota bacterium]|nr:tRNA pseudouridine(55) synthase TruB [Myxococcota bacterium]
MTVPFGLLIVKKPIGITSHDAVARVRNRFQWKVGHGGTLDPLATGVLPLLINDGTKLAPYMLDRDKAYRFTMKLGERTATLDREGEVIETRYVPPLTTEDIERNIKVFVGEQQQTPPMFSAVKVKGKPLYKHAHKGEEVERQARWIHIYSLDLVNFDSPSITLDVTCSKGTYIRQLALDISEALGSTAHVTALERTRSGPFDLDSAISLDALLAMTQMEAQKIIVSPTVALQFMPQIVVDEQTAKCLAQGKRISLPDDHFPEGKRMAFIDTSDRLLAIGEQTGDEIQPVKVFPHQVLQYIDAITNNNDPHNNQEKHHGNVNE